MKKILFVSLLISLIFSLSIYATSPPKLFISLATDKAVYKSSEIIASALTIFNPNSNSFKFHFTSSKKYDFYLSKDDKIIWKWSSGMMFSLALSEMTLEPKKPITYVIVFSIDRQLDPGKYKLVGAFCTREKEYLSKPLEIEIR